MAVTVVVPPRPILLNNGSNVDMDASEAAYFRQEIGVLGASDLSGNGGAALVGFQQAGAGSVLATVDAKLKQYPLALLDFIPVAEWPAIYAGTSTYDATAAIQAAINTFKVASRKRVIADPTFGPTDCYPGGSILFPRGRVKAAFDQLEITQVYGLTFEGQGCRIASDYQYGTSELVFSGTSSGYGLRIKGNGARGLTIRNMSVTYSGAFTGSLIDVYSSPGFHHENTYFGVDGLSAATNTMTAFALVQFTADEFYSPISPLYFNGARWGVYFNTGRSASSFGGLGADLSRAIFYNFTEGHIGTDGVYTMLGLVLHGTKLDCITTQPRRGLSLRNVVGVSIDQLHMGGTSTSFSPSVEWVTMQDCVGSIRNSNFGDGSPCGSLSGTINLEGNRVFNSTGGFRLRGGVITGRGQQFDFVPTAFECFPAALATGMANNGSGLIRVTLANHRLVTGARINITGTVGTTEANGAWTVTDVSNNTFDLQGSAFTNAYISGGTVSSSTPLTWRLGPDAFSASVTRSYDSNTDSELIDGHVIWSRQQDGSVNKFRNVSGRVSVTANDKKYSTIGAATYNISSVDTGRTLIANGGAGQTFTLQTSAPNTLVRVSKLSTQTLAISGLIVGPGYTGGAAFTSVAATTSAQGGQSILLRNFEGAFWMVEEQVGGWTYS